MRSTGGPSIRGEMKGLKKRESILDREERGKFPVVHMARKGNPISVRLSLNRSSDPSWFSEGDRESHRMGLAPLGPPRGRTLRRDGHDFFGIPKTTGRHPGPEHVVKEAHWVGVLRPSLRGTVECRSHEREAQDTRPIKSGNHSPEAPITGASGAPEPSGAGEA